MHFRPHSRNLRPIEPHRGGFLLHTAGAGQGWKRAWYTIQERLSAFLTLFRRLPALANLGRVLHTHITKDVRMASDELVHHSLEALSERKLLLFLGNAALKDNVQQHVSQLFLECLVVISLNAFNDLVGLLKHIGNEAGGRLLSIPRTALFRA